jgi:hypothetical protein
LILWAERSKEWASAIMFPYTTQTSVKSKKDKNSVYRLRFSRSLNTCVTVSQLNTVQNRYDDVLQSRSLFILFSISYNTLSREDYTRLPRFNAIEINWFGGHKFWWFAFIIIAFSSSLQHHATTATNRVTLLAIVPNQDQRRATIAERTVTSLVSVMPLIIAEAVAAVATTVDETVM